MNTSLNWIKAMVPGLDVTDQEFRDSNDTFREQMVENFTALSKILIKSLSDRLNRSKSTRMQISW